MKGALEAARLSRAAGSNPIEIFLVGDREEIEGELGKHEESVEFPIRVIPSEGKIREDEHSIQALRYKTRGSVVVATQLVREGRADALVSMGSTGAKGIRYLLIPKHGFSRLWPLGEEIRFRATIRLNAAGTFQVGVVGLAANASLSPIGETVRVIRPVNALTNAAILFVVYTLILAGLAG